MKAANLSAFLGMYQLQVRFYSVSTPGLSTLISSAKFIHPRGSWINYANPPKYTRRVYEKLCVAASANVILQICHLTADTSWSLSFSFLRLKWNELPLHIRPLPCPILNLFLKRTSFLWLFTPVGLWILCAQKYPVFYYVYVNAQHFGNLCVYFNCAL